MVSLFGFRRPGLVWGTAAGVRKVKFHKRIVLEFNNKTQGCWFCFSAPVGRGSSRAIPSTRLLTAIILKPTRLNFQNVCNSFANNDDFMKLTAIILKQTRLNFQNVYYSLGNNKSVYKNDENTLRFKGI